MDSCPICKGKGLTQDWQYLGITHEARKLIRKCRACKGTGKIEIPDWLWRMRNPGVEHSSNEDQVLGEIPDWMLED